MKYREAKFKVVCIFIVSFSILPFLKAQDLTSLQESARELRSKGYAAQAAGNVDGAMSFYQQAAALDPSCAIFYNDIGIMYEAKGEPQFAEEYYLKCIEFDPCVVSAYSNLAFLYEERREYEKAAYYWRKRVSLGEDDDPWTEKAKEHLRDVTAKLKMAGRIIDDEEEVLSAQSLSAQEEPSDVLISRAEEIYEDDKITTSLNLDEVLDKFEKDIKKEDDENLQERIDVFLTSASEAEGENQALKEKLQVFSQALADEKDKNKREKAQLYEQLATSYVQAKLYNEAIEAYKRALALDAAQPYIYYYLGLLYQYQKRDSKIAVECFREYLELDPYGKYNEKARDLINILQ